MDRTFMQHLVDTGELDQDTYNAWEHEVELEGAIEDCLKLALRYAAERWDRDYAYDYVGGTLEQWRKAYREANPEPKSLKPKQVIPARLRREVFERDAYRCKHCGGWESLQVDHIYPESKGGVLELDNLQTLCRKCNVRKGARV